MYPITPILTTGQQGAEVQNLQEILLYLLETGIINNQNTGIPVSGLQAEKQQSFFGDVTTQFVELFKTQYFLFSPPTQLVDGPVAGALNGFAGSQFPNNDLITIEGNVAHISGNILPTTYTVRIEQVLFSGNIFVGSTTMEDNGDFSITASASSLTEEGLNFAFVAVAEVDVSEEYSSEIAYIPINQRSVYLKVIVNNDIDVASEYISIKTKVEAVIGATDIKDITIDIENSQAEFLSKATNENLRDIRFLVIAHILSEQIDDLNPELFYGLLRNNLPEIAERLLFQSRITFNNAIAYSIEKNIISTYTTLEIDTFIDALKGIIITNWNNDNSSDLQKTITFRIYNSVLNNTTLTNEFITIFYDFEQENSDVSFWKHLEDEYSSFDSYIRDLKTVTVLSVIISNCPALVATLLGILKGDTFSGSETLDIISGDPQPQLLAILTVDNWIDIITDSKTSDASNFLFPDYVEGGNDTAKIEFYANRLWGNFVSIYPIYSLNASIDADIETPFPNLKENLSTFLGNNQNIDLRSLSMLALKTEGDSPYDLTDIDEAEDFLKELATLQRLSALTSSYTIMAALASDNIISAFHLNAFSKEEFIETYGGLFPNTEDAEYFLDLANAITTHVLGRVYENYGKTNDPVGQLTGVPFNPEFSETPIGGEGFSAFSVGSESYADWRLLFGSVDSCTCCHCESIFSPTAYFVETLNFLRNSKYQSWYDLVYNRRADLKGIELTCDNANIAVPHIDLVNEMLEDLISEDKIYPRQTQAAAEYQLAIPEYMNTDGYAWVIPDSGGITIDIATPYTNLRESKYPWTLPYNVYKRQIDAHLTIPGIKSYELLQRFSNKDLVNSLDDLTFCTHYLNISAELRDIITTASALSSVTKYKDLQVHYGLTISYDPTSAYRGIIPDPLKRGDSITLSESTWVENIAGRVDIFLQQTKLKYRDLLELLDCYYINPFSTLHEGARKFAVLSNGVGSDITTCRLNELGIIAENDADLPAFLDRLHRFVRLSKALNWHYYDLDIALRAVGGDTLNSTSFKRFAQLKYLSESLKIKVSKACILFQDIEILPYRDYRHEDENCELIDIPDQYSSIFRNPTMSNANLINPFPPSPAEDFEHIEFDVLRNFLAGILQLNPSDTQILLNEIYTLYSGDVSGSTFEPSFESLSYIYRQSILIKALRLSVDEWMFYKLWAGTDNYFGNIVDDPNNNTAAKPLTLHTASITYNANPFDTIRFVHYVNLFKNTGFSYTELNYLLIDKPLDQVEDIKTNLAISEILDSLRTDLFKKWYPEFNSAGTNPSEKLLTILKTIIDEADAKELMIIVDREPDSDIYTSSEFDFVSIELSYFLNNGGDVLTNSASGDYLASITDRYDYVYSSLVNYITDSVLKPLILSAFAKYLRISEDGIQVLLNDVIRDGMNSGFDLLLNEDFVFSVNEISRWSTFEDQYFVTLLLQKAAILISKFGLGTLDIQYLWAKTVVATSDPVIPYILKIDELPIRAAVDTVFVPGTNSVSTLRVFRNLLQWMEVRAFVGSDINILFQSIEQDSDIVETLAAVFKISTIDINTLIVDHPSSDPTDDGILNIDSSMYQSPLSYIRIIDCLEMQYLMPAPMLTLYKVGRATRNPTNQSEAAEVIHLVRAPYEDKQWLEIVKPANDTLRVERRDAMLAYLLAYPVTDYEYSWLSSNDIYETLLVDVEMMPVMMTTRILLANNTVQLWIDRVLLQLEADVLPASASRQWTSWRKIYRVWEANRKVFVYPENWIEPELRDDKTPLFVELEKFLQQNDVNKDTVEAAYKTYLERLDQLSRLDIIGIYRETNQGDYTNSEPDNYEEIIHAFGRTKELPHIYYYRKRVKFSWTAWQKIEVQIEGDHFIPTMWKGRLRLYWLVFIKDTEEVPTSSIQSEGSWNQPPGVRWKIQLAWTELKDKTWTGKSLSKEPIYSQYIYEEKPLSPGHLDRYIHRKWNESGDLEKIKKESIVFIANKDNDGHPSFSVIERDYFCKGDELKYIYDVFKDYNKAFYYSKNWMDTDFNNWSAKVWRRNWYHIGRFTVKFNGVQVQPLLDSGDEAALGRSLYIDSSDSGAFKRRDLQNNGYWPSNTDYWYNRDAKEGYSHFPDGNIKLLDSGPNHYLESVVESFKKPSSGGGPALVEYHSSIVRDKYKSRYLVFPRQIPNNFVSNTAIQIPYFFYKDNINTFFVEKVLELYSIGMTDSIMVSGDTLFDAGKFLPAKADTVSGTSIGIDWGVGTATSDTVHPLDDVEWSTGGVSYAYEGSPMVLYRYRFHNFTHGRINDFLEKIDSGGVDALLNESRQYLEDMTDRLDFETIYRPTSNTHFDIYAPNDKVDFRLEGAFTLYNWELFFHIPMLIANKLSQNQQFADARLWYHYVFNPTQPDTGSFGSRDAKRFWNFIPFYRQAESVETIDTVMGSTTLTRDLENWAANPFKPHLIARTRLTAYMKNAVMKYLDNLIAWGDNLFNTDSREAINEATLLYILAQQILGRRPEVIPARTKPVPQRYEIINYMLTPFGNILVDAENVLLSSGAEKHFKNLTLRIPVYHPITRKVIRWIEYKFTVDVNLKGSMYLFCIPYNEKLMQYWDILADRLFKIRNSQSIDGVTRELALFDPPIDPAILVRAAASGVSLAGILGDLNAPLPSYRYNVMSQKAGELASEVKSLGGQLLAALEKRDAEHISLLRSSQELKVLQMVSDIKERQIEESKSQWESLSVQLKSATQRQAYYNNLLSNGLLGKEVLQLTNMQDTIPLQIAQGVVQGIGGILGSIPQISGPIPKAEFGGQHLSSIMTSATAVIGIRVNELNVKASMAGINAGYERRRQDWELQNKLAKFEVEQINKQMIAAEIRYEIAKMEQKNHLQQLNNAQEMDIVMREKFTNEELYDWLIGQISFTYFQGYKLAYETAKKAERCFRYELNLDTSDFIQYGYWDSLKKGLQAGENLSYDLNRMSVAFLDKNKRQLELTKHISLSALNPEHLIELKTKKICTFSIPEWLYDMDYPGQHMRRIKSISISIPCVAGPYTTISCKLSQVSSKYRKNGFLLDGVYEEDINGDTRFNYLYGNIQSIATSNAQNDSGMFELNFKDERYLPFEGKGAISTWSLELPAALPQFDYKTISDVIIHLKYTAIDSGSTKIKAKEYVQSIISAENGNDNLYRVFDLKQEFSNEWHQLLNGTTSNQLILDNIKDRLSYMSKGLVISKLRIEIFSDQKFNCKMTNSNTTPVTYNTSSEVPMDSGNWQVSLSDVINLDVSSTLHLHIDPANSDILNTKECWMVLQYTATEV